MVTVEYARCAVTMGVGSIIDARSRLWSRTCVLERPSVVSAPGKGGGDVERVKEKAVNGHAWSNQGSLPSS